MERTSEPNVVSPANKRVVFYTNEGFYDPDLHVHGTGITGAYAVAEVVEDERGYRVYSWQTTLESARTTAAALNAATGMSDQDVLDVVVSSMRLGNRSWE